jgi:integrase
MPLTDAKIRTLKPQAKPKRYADGGGLYLEVTPAGSKLWRYKYRFDGREKRLALGAYPDVPLAGRKQASTGIWIPGARDLRDEARQLRSAGIDPGVHKAALKRTRAEKNKHSFEVIAREWARGRAKDHWVPSHGSRILARLERDIFPYIGADPIGDIAAPRLLEVVRRIESRGRLETAHRALSDCGRIFRYAISTGRADRNVAADLKGALPPARGNHHAAITEPSRVGDLLLAFEGYIGTEIVRAALHLAPLVWVRPGELRHARWADIDLDAKEWRFTLSKTNTPHIVPLCRQAVAILRDLHPLTRGSDFVFPGGRSVRRPMSNNAVLAALRSLGIRQDEMSGHGFRAMARTIGAEVLKFPGDHIDHQLGHAVKDPNGRAYNRTTFLPERHEMLQRWADYLDELKAEAILRAQRQQIRAVAN